MKHKDDAKTTATGGAEGQVTGERVERRGFFKMVGLGALAGAAAVAAPGTVSTAEAEPEAKGAGYRETAHVKTYYELAKF